MKETIKSILEHEVYTKHVKGQERIDGILGEIMEEGFIDEESYESLLGKPFTFDCVEDVIAVINSTKSHA